MEIKKVPLSHLKSWEKNPRAISQEDYKRLKKQISELGVYKPLVAYEENGKYTVLGGNMRLKAFQELKIINVEVSVINPKNEAEKLKYALSDNDRAGYYVEQDLAELVHIHKEDIDLGDYKVDLGKFTSLEDIISPIMPSDKQPDPVEIVGNAMTIVIKVPNDIFAEVETKIKTICEEFNLEIDVS